MERNVLTFNTYGLDRLIENEAKSKPNLFGAVKRLPGFMGSLIRGMHKAYARNLFVLLEKFSANAESPYFFHSYRVRAF